MLATSYFAGRSRLPVLSSSNCKCICICICVCICICNCVCVCIFICIFHQDLLWPVLWEPLLSAIWAAQCDSSVGPRSGKLHVIHYTLPCYNMYFVCVNNVFVFVFVYYGYIQNICEATVCEMESIIARDTLPLPSKAFGVMDILSKPRDFK